MNQITGADEKVKANAIGELKFNKAFAYFMLTKAYGDIPMFNVAISEGASYEQPRRPIAEVYAEIIRLLEEAIPVMYKNTDVDFQEGHVAQGAAAGLLAKVYVTMASGSMTAGEEMIVKTGASYEFNNGEKVLVLPTSKTFRKTQVAGYESFDTKDCYTKAAQYAKDVMGGKYGSYDLLPYDELWKRSNYNKAEHMFMLQTLNNDEEYGNTIHRWFSGTENAQGLIQQGQWIGNRYHWYTLFDSKDYRITKGVKHRFRYSYQASDNYGFYYPNTPEYKLMATGYDENGNKVADPVAPYNDGVQYTFNVSSSTLAYSTKYSDVTDPTVERSDAYWPFLRYADIVLIYAEAMCELGSGVDSEAIKALNAIRTRSNANPAVTSGNGAIDSKVALRSAIFEERAKELALEGDSPALAMMRSGVCSAQQADIQRRSSSVSRRSRACVWTSAPLARQRTASCSRTSCRRPSRMSCMPGAAYSSASALPSAPVAPVISTLPGRKRLRLSLQEKNSVRAKPAEARPL